MRKVLGVCTNVMNEGIFFLLVHQGTKAEDIFTGPRRWTSSCCSKHILHCLEDVQRQRSPSEILQSALGIKDSLPKAPERSLLKPNEWNWEFLVTILFVSLVKSLYLRGHQNKWQKQDIIGLIYEKFSDRWFCI